MVLNIRSLAVYLLLATGLFSCIDHRLGGPASPARLRLRSVQSVEQNSNTNYTYTYSYDSQNRPVSIDRVFNGKNSLAVIAYGDPQLNYVNNASGANYTFYIEYPDPADKTQGQATPYPLPLDGVSFTVRRYYLLRGKVFSDIYDRTYQYTFDADKRISGYLEIGSSSPIDQNGYRYAYTGENITSEQFSTAAGHGVRGTATYTYDAQPNPFFGLLDPAIDQTTRFSRNNITSVTYSTTSLPNVTYAYEYNAQGLPTKRTATSPSGTTLGTIVYTYENY
ncbi:hypothetical protein [Spirosoma rhododendri]|uniref:YD repeat-containing protein n=1 Tax=Spirosoma rhododendri TaxID=2728024 RepID=A0A7L5DKJ6_9BACT|nr:hypothetical protein [Spirosoma rhododendri]QJD78946.1 hypothetical protein HH216_11305 [Spirosoma rhododendri]